LLSVMKPLFTYAARSTTTFMPGPENLQVTKHE
jgi:hypothetical protein